MKDLILLIVVFSCSFIGIKAQDVHLDKQFPSIEMTAIKMYDQTTLYRIDTIQVKLGRYELGEIGCNVFLKDINSNGKYNDIGIDQIGLLDKYTDTIIHSYQAGISFASLNETPSVLIDEIALSLDSIAENGSLIRLNAIEEQPSEPLARTVTYLPNILLKGFGGENKNLSDFLKDEKFVYLEFWGTWCNPCIKLIPELTMLDSAYKDKLVVVGLNYSDDVKKAMSFIKKNNMTWPQFSVDKNFLKMFSVVTLPRGILFNKYGILEDMNISPYELKRFLEKQNND